MATLPPPSPAPSDWDDALRKLNNQAPHLAKEAAEQAQIRSELEKWFNSNGYDISAPTRPLSPEVQAFLESNYISIRKHIQEELRVMGAPLVEEESPSWRGCLMFIHCTVLYSINVQFHPHKRNGEVIITINDNADNQKTVKTRVVSFPAPKFD